MKKYLAILFSDLEGYSKLDDRFYPIVEELNESIKYAYLTTNNHCYLNTWGDAFFICSENCYDAAEIALKIRDHVATFNWRRHGLPHALRIRIGLHFAYVDVVIDDRGQIKNVIGKGITSSARIEPIVPPGKVYCSKIFNNLLADSGESHIIGTAVGKKSLAKDFGEMHLFELMWEHESIHIPTPKANSQPDVYIPELKADASDKEKKDFLHHSYEIILDHFERGMIAFTGKARGIEISLRKITNAKFMGELFNKGDHVSSCLIWVGGFLSDSIQYSEGLHIDPNYTSSYNESLSVSSDASELRLKASGMSFFYDTNLTYSPDSMTPENAADFLWRKFIQRLR